MSKIEKVKQAMETMEALGIEKEEPISLERFIDIDSFIGMEETDSHLVYFPDMNEGLDSRAERKRERLDLVVQTLTEHEEKVLRMRFGVGDEASDPTLEEFAAARERIRANEIKPGQKNRQPRSSKTLRAFLG